MQTQSNAVGKAFCLFDNIEITDSAKLEEYKSKVFPVVASFGGKYLVAGDNINVVEGSWQPRYLVMIEFPSFEEANRWYHSEEYKELKDLRKSSGRFNGVIFEGL
jgi:uncharacterized protein (DUF1330 family)